MSKVWAGDEIQYDAIAARLRGASGEQELVPFLGAGVSLSDRNDPNPTVAPDYPDPATVERFADELKLAGTSRHYLEYAIRMAMLMQAWEVAHGALPDRAALQAKLKGSLYPPAAWELAEMFSLATAYHSFSDRALKAIERGLLADASRAALKDQLLPMLKLAAIATDLASPTDPLTSISGYYEVTGARGDLWKLLHDIISPKAVPTGTHRLIADVARTHLAQPNAEDYLIITTNYDSLMEQALSEDPSPVPFAALWRDREGMVHTRFANLPEAERLALERRNPKRLADKCLLNKPKPLAIVYKIHGCLHPDQRESDDGLVISDNDYVQFISDLNSAIPSHVGSLLGAKRLLFLGYSFGDWNVRSLYERIKKRADSPLLEDYAVSRALSKFEASYFERRQIIVALTDLQAFVKGVRAKL